MNEREASQEIDNHRATVMEMQRKAKAMSQDGLRAAYDANPWRQGGPNAYHYVLQYELFRRYDATPEGRC